VDASPGSRARLRAIGHGLIVAGLLYFGYLFVIVAPLVQTFGFDSFAYWNVDLADPYAIPHGDLGSFPYSPPIAILFDPFGALPWWEFQFMWFMLLVGTVIFIGWTPIWILAAFAFPPVASELYHGNIHILLAVAVVLGFRHPWTWSFVLLTKPSGGIGLLWFAVRREWRPLGVALAVTAVICLASFVFVPSLWPEWVSYLLATDPGDDRSAFPVSIFIRLPLAAALVVWGARTDRRWTVAAAATLALPYLWVNGLAMLIAVIPELRGHTWSWRLARPGSTRSVARLVDA
jgi:hypothetical protein